MRSIHFYKTVSGVIQALKEGKECVLVNWGTACDVYSPFGNYKVPDYMDAYLVYTEVKKLYYWETSKCAHYVNKTRFIIFTNESLLTKINNRLQ